MVRIARQGSLVGLVLLTGCLQTGSGLSLGQLVLAGPSNTSSPQRLFTEDFRAEITAKGPFAAAQSYIAQHTTLSSEMRQEASDLFKSHERALIEGIAAGLPKATDQYQVNAIASTALKFRDADILSKRAVDEIDSAIKRHVLQLNLEDRIDITLNSDLFRYDEFRNTPHLDRIIARSIKRVEAGPSFSNEMDQLAIVYLDLPQSSPYRRRIEQLAADLPSDSKAVKEAAFAKAFPEIARRKQGEALASRVEVNDDKFEKAVRFLGRPSQHDSPLYGIADTNTYRLRSWLDRNTGAMTHQLYVSHFYSGEWIFWHRASDDQANTLEFVSIARNVISCRSGCSYSEAFGVTIPHRTLERARNTGLSIKFFARTGREKVIHLSSDDINAQLFAMERKAKELKASS
jgi:hypothetical protein